MGLVDTIVSAFDALRVHRLRSALTMLGVIIGTSAMIAMVAVGGGARQQVLQQIKILGPNLLIIWPGSVTQSGARLGAYTAATLTDEDADAIMREIPAVQVTAAIVTGKTRIVAGAANLVTGVTGIDLRYLEARAWDIDLGRMFVPEEIRRGAQVAIIGRTVANKLFDLRDPIGEEMRVQNVPFQVVGVMAAKGQSISGEDHDDVVFLPLVAARHRVLGRNPTSARAASLVFVKVRTGESMVRTQADVGALLRQRHGLQNGRADDFGMHNLADIAKVHAANARTLASLLAAIAGVSLVVGGIGIMNIMLVSVTERTREIGLRLALGARRRDVMRQFLFEAIGLAAIGGMVGVLFGIGVAYMVAHLVGWPLLILPESILFAVLLSGLVGVFFGWYPAYRASRLEPTEALCRS